MLNSKDTESETSHERFNRLANRVSQEISFLFDQIADEADIRDCRSAAVRLEETVRSLFVEFESIVETASLRDHQESFPMLRSKTALLSQRLERTRLRPVKHSLADSLIAAQVLKSVNSALTGLAFIINFESPITQKQTDKSAR